jgi:hypothetical protein
MFSLRPEGEKTPSFNVGRDMEGLKLRIKSAGFSNFRIWSKQCIMELWDAARVVSFWAQSEKRDIEGEDKDWASVLLARVTEAMKKGLPIGLEIIVIIAKA